MFDHLIKENNLSDVFKSKDLKFVKELILCPEEKVCCTMQLTITIAISVGILVILYAKSHSAMPYSVFWKVLDLVWL